MGFSSQPVKKEEVYKKSLTYSNLSDSSSQNEVRKAMKLAGIAPKATNTCHVGVLIPTKDGKLLFLEKLVFQEPYQAAKFKNRTE